jgi:hypothetical protein
MAQITISQIIRAGWKQLANCDQSDVDEVAKILRETLEALEAIETVEK